MKTISKQIFSLGLLLLATACTQEQLNENSQMPDGVFPLQIASVTVGGEGEAHSRVAENNDGSGSVFKTADIFCVQFANNSKVGTYRITDDAGHCEAENAIYWVSTNTYLTGWYPISTTIDLSNQTDGLAYLLKATSDRIDYTTQPTLTFTNQLAKVRISLEFIGVEESANVIEEVQIKSYTSCTHEKGVIVSSDASASEDNYIKMHKATYNGKTYWEANLVPGVLGAAEALKFKRNGVEETFSLDSDVTLEAGKLSLITIPVHDNSYKYVYLNLLTAETTISEKSILLGTTSQRIIIADGTDITLCGAIINNQIKCEGDATIHLLSKNVVTCSSENRAGIEAGPSDKTLKIDGSGKMTVTGGRFAAGIGSGRDTSCGAITISGGTIVATGGQYGAGIGSGYYNSSCGAITISGGTIVAMGDQYGAGIGSGGAYNYYHYPTCGAITISGGTITANGQDGAGIGSGRYGSSCDAIEISGGTITANGQRGAGIGSGHRSSTCGAITISGGTITANGQDGAGIGSGNNHSSCSAITISGGTITATGSLSGAGIGSGENKSSCGAITISGVSGMRVNSGAYNSACIGKGNQSGNVGEIKVTNSSIILDNSGGTNAPYFNPSPTVNTGNKFYDKDGKEITL